MIEKLIAPITNLLRYQKKYILLTFLFVFIFIFILFPYNDLTDFITQQVAQKSKNQIFLKFNNLSLGILPPSLKMEKVSVDTPLLPTIHAGALSLAPSIPALLRFSPGIEARIYKVFGGNIFLEYSQGKPLNEKTRLQKVTLDLKKVELKPLTQFLSMPVQFKGLINSNIDAEFDPTFAGQPDGQIQVEVDGFVLPLTAITLNRLPINIPEISLSHLKLLGEIKNSVLKIESLDIGADSDSIKGKISGTLNVRLTDVDGRIVPEINGYDFLLDLNVDSSGGTALGPMLIFLDTYKSTVGTRTRYAFRVSGANFQSQPRFSPPQ